jgi:hypothetical protein
MNELFIIIIIILVLWFINKNTTHKKSNKPVKKDFFLNMINPFQPYIPHPNAKECTIDGQLCTSYTPGALGHNWICHDKKWVPLPPTQLYQPPQPAVPT